MGDRTQTIFPLDPMTRTACTVYAPSPQILKLTSESNRQIFAEDLQKGEFQVETLQQLSLRVLIESFKTGQPDPNISLEAVEQFGYELDTNKPLLEVIDLEINSFWRRVCEKKCYDPMKYQVYAANPKAIWKRLGVETMLAELIETMEPLGWDEELLEQLGPKVAPFVESLTIRRMVPSRLNLENPLNPDVRVANVPNEWCNHGSLAGILGSLVNLTELSLVFGTGSHGVIFKPYFLELSFQDIYNLSLGLEKLTKLTTLRLKHNKLDELKLKTVTRVLEKLSVSHLDLGYCYLDDMCGYPIASLLQTNSHLRELELEGNRLAKKAMQTIGFVLETYSGPLVYLGLSKNPIDDDGVLHLGGGVRDTENVQNLDLSACDLTANGVMRVTTLVGIHKALVRLSIANLPFDWETGCSLVQNLELNSNIEELDCRGCGLTENQELKIRILLAKNRYYKQKAASQIEPEEVTTDEEVVPEVVPSEDYDERVNDRILYIEAKPIPQHILFERELKKAQEEARKAITPERRVTFSDF